MITVAFVFWGIGPKDNPKQEFVAEIGDRKISLEDYWREYDNEYRKLKDQGTTEEDIEKLKLGETVLGRIVSRTVLMLAAEEAGITVTERELQQAIMNTTYFQRNGVFDPQVYQRLLRNNRMSVSHFEASFRNDLIVTKMTRLIGETAELSSEELKILDSIQGGNRDQLAEIFRGSKSSQTVNAYIESIKRQLYIKVNRDLIS
jgi:peptidyl-prolyl cis-trans isomerase D